MSTWFRKVVFFSQLLCSFILLNTAFAEQTTTPEQTSQTQTSSTTQTTAPQTLSTPTPQSKPANSPNVEQAMMIAKKAVMAIYTYDYNNYQQQFNSAKQYFTQAGWDSFQKALDDSKNIETVKSRQLTVTATQIEKEKLMATKKVNGRPLWIISMPISVKYQSSDGRTVTQTLRAIVAVTTEDNNKLGVNQLVIQAMVESQGHPVPTTDNQTTTKTPQTNTTPTPSTTQAPTTTQQQPSTSTGTSTQQQPTTNTGTSTQ